MLYRRHAHKYIIRNIVATIPINSVIADNIVHNVSANQKRKKTRLSYTIIKKPAHSHVPHQVFNCASGPITNPASIFTDRNWVKGEPGLGSPKNLSSSALGIIITNPMALFTTARVGLGNKHRPPGWC